MKISYTFFYMKVKLLNIKRKIKEYFFKNKYCDVYELLIPSIHKGEGNQYNECTILHSYEQMVRIHKLCEEKDCYIIYKVERVLKSELNRFNDPSCLDYYTTIDRLEKIKTR